MPTRSKQNRRVPIEHTDGRLLGESFEFLERFPKQDRGLCNYELNTYNSLLQDERRSWEAVRDPQRRDGSVSWRTGNKKVSGRSCSSTTTTSTWRKVNRDDGCGGMTAHLTIKKLPRIVEQNQCQRNVPSILLSGHSGLISQ